MPRTSPRPTAERREAAEYLGDLRIQQLPELISATVVGRFLGVSRQTVHVLVATGELAAIQINRKSVRVFRRSLEEFLKRKLE